MAYRLTIPRVNAGMLLLVVSLTTYTSTLPGITKSALLLVIVRLGGFTATRPSIIAMLGYLA